MKLETELGVISAELCLQPTRHVNPLHVFRTIFKGAYSRLDRVSRSYLVVFRPPTQPGRSIRALLEPSKLQLNTMITLDLRS